MGCVASIQATSVASTPSTGAVSTQERSSEERKVVSSTETVMMATKIADKTNLLDSFDQIYETFDNPWLKLKNADYMKSLCQASISSWAGVEDQNQTIKLVKGVQANFNP